LTYKHEHILPPSPLHTPPHTHTQDTTIATKPAVKEEEKEVKGLQREDDESMVKEMEEVKRREDQDWRKKEEESVPKEEETLEETAGAVAALVGESVPASVAAADLTACVEQVMTEET